MICMGFGKLIFSLTIRQDKDDIISETIFNLVYAFR
jgi:hypothetical protein